MEKTSVEYLAMYDELDRQAQEYDKETRRIEKMRAEESDQMWIVRQAIYNKYQKKMWEENKK